MSNGFLASDIRCDMPTRLNALCMREATDTRQLKRKQRMQRVDLSCVAAKLISQLSNPLMPVRVQFPDLPTEGKSHDLFAAL